MKLNKTKKQSKHKRSNIKSETKQKRRETKQKDTKFCGIFVDWSGGESYEYCTFSGKRSGTDWERWIGANIAQCFECQKCVLSIGIQIIHVHWAYMYNFYANAQNLHTICKCMLSICLWSIWLWCLMWFDYWELKT